MTSSIDITPEQREALLALLHRHLPGVTVRAYGSRVKGTAGPNSDLDLVVFHFSVSVFSFQFSAFQLFSFSAFQHFSISAFQLFFVILSETPPSPR